MRCASSVTIFSSRSGRGSASASELQWGSCSIGGFALNVDVSPFERCLSGELGTPFVGLTLTMIYAAIAPEAALRSTFGETVGGPVADVVVRNWGALIALMGVMLIYGAREPAARPLALAVAGASKAIFIALALAHGGRFLGYQAGIVVAIDLVWVVVFASIYLLCGDAEAGLKPGTIGTAWKRIDT